VCRIRFADRELEYVLTRKRVKNINLRIHTDGSVCVSAGPLVPLSAIEAFILSKERYIAAALDRYGEFDGCTPAERGYADGEVFYYLGRELRLKVGAGDKNEAYREGDCLYLRVKNPDDRALRERTIVKWKDAESKRILSEIVDAAYPAFRKHGVPAPTLVFRDMKSRWGSCQPKSAKITLNKRLIGVPRDCIEYVVAHEFAHFLHPNHSKNFYGFLATVMPDWKERKKNLESAVLRKL
jgi:predicted metal-dependent hydrolase